jgi:stage II sporulation protein D
MVRRRIAVLLALPFVAAAAASAQSPPGTVGVTTFVIRGHGWGHGLGMPQWGAYGMARKGFTYDKILAYYYRGTQLGQVTPTSVRVLLAVRRKVTVSSAAGLTVQDAAGTARQLPAGSYTVGPDYAVTGASTGQPLTLQGPLTFVPGTAPLQLGKPYRGRIQVQVVGNKLQAVDVVGLEAYLRGVVTQEMPKAWPLAALEAQAVAARTYALAEQQKGAILYPDVRSQVYGGLLAETPAASEAVAATKGQVVLYGGSLATTYYCSSSGGRTASYTDVFPDRPAIPYLVSVADPYDAGSPYHSWGPLELTAGQVSKALHVSGVTDLVPDRVSARAREVTVTGLAGDVALPAAAVRKALGLRSTWFSTGVLVLSRPAGTFASGQAITLSGEIERVKDPVSLEQKPAGEDWQAGPELVRAADGTFAVSVAPTVTTQYRLVAGDVRTSPIRVSVSGQG